MRFDPATDWALLLAVPAIPLLGYVVNIFLGKNLPGGAIGCSRAGCSS